LGSWSPFERRGNVILRPARYKTACKSCGGEIQRGEMALMEKRESKWEAAHPSKCPPKKEPIPKSFVSTAPKRCGDCQDTRLMAVGVKDGQIVMGPCSCLRRAARP